MNKKVFDAIYKNETLKKTFISDIENNRLSHAFIIEGVEGSGKLTLARTVLASMQTNEVHIEQIMNGVCSDVFEIDVPDDKKRISVDAVRLIRTSSVIKAGDLDIKGYIIKNSELMTQQAQNAFLKILEEPTQGVYFFLLTTNASALLPTVRSRAPVVRTEIFSVEDLRSYLVNKVQLAAQLSRTSPDKLDALLHRSGGAIGTALKELELLSQGGVSSQSQIFVVLEALTQANRFETMSKVNDFCANREKAESFLTSMRAFLRDLMIVKSGAKADTASLQTEVLENYASRLSVGRILNLDVKIEALLFDLEFFPNISSFRLSVFKTLWDGLR